MARRGSFGGGLPTLHPYGSLGNGFAQYNVGKTATQLAETRRYAVEVAWANGKASNAEYLAVLEEALAATDPDTPERISAQNKLDDARFRIGRDLAKQSGDPEALIAFDQAALAAMNPNSLRYADLKDTLNAELANRRSTAYGKLIEQYQAGTIKTPDLLAWITNTLATLSADAPDRESWKSAKAEIASRVQSEMDATVVQDYQHQRMKPEAYLAWLTSRRDSYLRGSALYAEWDRRLEDASEQIKQAKLAEQDSAFFAAYNRGRKGDPGDAEYLDYIRKRLAGMAADDPSRTEWQARLDKAIYSLAEDRLILEVAKETRPQADLVAFYSHYLTTLNPDSPEYRTVSGKLDAAERADFLHSESMLRFKVEHHLLGWDALVTFYADRLKGLDEGTDDWRAAYNNWTEAKQQRDAVAAGKLAFQADNPGVDIGTGLTNTLPMPDGGTTTPGGTGTSTGGSTASPGAVSTGGSDASRVMAAASMFLREIGAPDTVGNRQAVATWMYQEGVSSSFARNNPLNLHSSGGLPGQTGSKYINKNDKNVAVFDTLEHGVAANARNLTNLAKSHPEYGYGAMLDALRANNPKGFIDAAAKSDWAASGYGTRMQTASGQWVANPNGKNNLYATWSAHFGSTLSSDGGAPAPPVAATGTGSTPPPAPGPMRPARARDSGPGTDVVPTAPNPSTEALVSLEHELETQLAGLVQGSPEWIATYGRLQNVKEALAKPDQQAVGSDTPWKAISPRDSLETVVHQVTISPGSSPFAVANYELNHDSLYNAWQNGDKVWLFFDPANPNATTFQKNPDGSYALDEKGNRILIRGSGYYAVTSESVARMQQVKVGYLQSMSEAARAAGQNVDAVKYQNQSIEANNVLRGIDNRVYRANLRAYLDGDGTQPGIVTQIEHGWATGDLAAVVNGTTAALSVIHDLQADPMLDDQTRALYNGKAEKLATSALMPDPSENRAGAIDTERSIGHLESGRWIWDKIVLTPTNHLVFKMEGGAKTFDVVNTDGMAPGVWESTHLKINVQVGDRLVTGEAAIHGDSPVNLGIAATVDGEPRLFNFNNTAWSATFFDGSGIPQTAYSIDNGQSWIRSNTGVPPQVSIRGKLTAFGFDAERGVWLFNRAISKDIEEATLGRGMAQTVLAVNTNGVVVQADPSMVEWYGQSDAVAALKTNPFADDRVQRLYNSGASRAEIRAAIMAAQSSAAPQVNAQVGGPGQSMTLSFRGADGSVDMRPANFRLLPDVLPTGEANTANDFIGKTVAQIVADGYGQASGEYDVLPYTRRGVVSSPGLPRMPGLFDSYPDTAYNRYAPVGGFAGAGPLGLPSRYDEALPGNLAIAAQLPEGTPPRIPGVSLDAVTAIPLRPLPPPPTPLPAPLPAPKPASLDTLVSGAPTRATTTTTTTTKPASQDTVVSGAATRATTTTTTTTKPTTTTTTTKPASQDTVVSGAATRATTTTVAPPPPTRYAELL